MKNLRLHKILLVLLVLISLVIKLSVTDWNKTLVGDEIGYDKMVKQLIDQGIYGYKPYSFSKASNAFTTPGYPLFIAPFYILFGYDANHAPVSSIQLMQILISLGTSLLIYLISRKLFEAPWISLICLSLSLFHPSFVYSPSFLLTERSNIQFFSFFIFICPS